MRASVPALDESLFILYNLDLRPSCTQSSAIETFVRLHEFLFHLGLAKPKIINAYSQWTVLWLKSPCRSFSARMVFVMQRVICVTLVIFVTRRDACHDSWMYMPRDLIYDS